MSAALAPRWLWPWQTRDAQRGKPVAPTLSLSQIRWIGLLLFAAQLPQAPFLPAWIAVFGVTLVALRMWFATRDSRRPHATPTRIPSWALVFFALITAWFVRVSFDGHLAGRDPSVAFLYILVGIKFLEARSRRDGTLLVCLAMFMLITPFLATESAFAALAMVPALVLLGATLEALARAGTTTGARSALKRSALLLLQGIPLAAALFVLFPRLSAPLWGLPQDYAAQSGLSDTMAPGMISELSLSDAVAFRVDFDGPPPPQALRYWRGPVLTRFDGRVWSALPQRGEGTYAMGGPSIRYTVALEPSFKPWLFALEMASGPPELSGNLDDTLPARPALTPDQQLITRGAIAQVTRYVQQSILRSHFPAASDLDVRLARLPSPGNPRAKALAREMRERYPDDAAYAAAILKMFHDENFVYTLTPPLLPGDPVDMFLFDERRGFCEHFASAFTVLLRDGGIPARVVTGYQGGEINPRGGYMIVRQSDAHAWTEAYIDGEWRRYDPTAAVAPNRIEHGIGGSLPAGEPVPLFARLDGGWLKNVQLALDAMNHAWRRDVIGFNHSRQRELWRDLRITADNAPWVVGAVAAAIGLWGALVLAWMTWRRQKGERAQLLWHAACARLEAAGLPRQAHEGPLDYARRASARWPQFAIAFNAIAESYAALRYGAPAERPGARAALLATLARAIDVLPPAAALRTQNGAAR
jgi:transglutaminase-like putative cysteine protease